MTLRTHRVVLAAACLLSWHPPASVCAGSRSGAEDLIAEIARHEEIVQNISAKIVVTVPEENRTFMELDWGYSHGREYLEGTQYLDVAGVGDRIAHSVKNAFDGEVMRLYRHDPLMRRHNGRVTSLEPENFTGFPTPNVLLGHQVNPSGRLTMAEALRQARDVTVQPVMQEIDGHPCYLVEAVEIYPAPEPGMQGGDVRLWVDPARDYRMLKFEMYASEAPPLRWKEIRRCIDNIKLEQINGAWIPVAGDFHSLLTEMVPKPGTSKEEIQKMPLEEAILHVDFKPVHMVPMRRIQVDVANLNFGTEIPAEKFTIQWPAGTTVWDDFAQTSYKVGALGEVSLRDAPVDGLAEASASPSADGTTGGPGTDGKGAAGADTGHADASQNRERSHAGSDRDSRDGGAASEEDAQASGGALLGHGGVVSALVFFLAIVCFVGLAYLARRRGRADQV